MDRLVEKAIQESQAKRVAKMAIKTWDPDIIISRDPGSGGSVIAKKVARRLGWKLFDKELMLELSRKLSIPPETIEHVDEHTRSWLADMVHFLFNSNYVSDMRYVTALKKILLHAAKQGDMVILGRGANFIIPEEKCLRVRITASFKTRVESTYTYEHKTSREEAAAWVRHVQRNRDRFIRQYFGANPHNPWYYDLVISTDHLSLDQATDLVIQAYLAKFPDEKRRLKTKLT
jgi:cytidylate kinase